MSRVDWLWEDEGWSEFTEFAGDMGEAALDPLQAYVPGVDVGLDIAEYIENTNSENLADIFVPEEFEGMVGVAGDYGPGGENNTSYIFPDEGIVGGNGPDEPLPPSPPTPVPDPDAPVVCPVGYTCIPNSTPTISNPIPSSPFDDAFENENGEEEITFVDPSVPNSDPITWTPTPTPTPTPTGETSSCPAGMIPNPDKTRSGTRSNCIPDPAAQSGTGTTPTPTPVPQCCCCCCPCS